MLYRYNTIDVVVGVGMCAVIFGALLFLFAASGALMVPSSSMLVEPSGMSGGSALLQQALGEAVVERILLQRQTDHITSAAAAEWERAFQSFRGLQAVSARPFFAIERQAETIPAEHEARVQAVMGRHIVNFTGRGLRSGVFSADQYVSDYNNRMIDATESMGQRLHRDFVATWQPRLGQWIVEAVRDYAGRERTIQEQLGAAIVHLAQAKTMLNDAWAGNQYQIGSLMAAAERSGIAQERFASTARPGSPVSPVSTGGRLLDRPERMDIPMSYLIAAALGLCVLFFGGLVAAGSAREAKAIMESKRESSRWVYRMAA
ncbi:MAG TPA: hypothetical protein VJ746_01920 [Nitrospira sp.]|nr:hypothetical protein [Nitrospira sp.]